ncbi:hypothetical protein CHS0354_004869 [Potamilus streckersoni]|uniref:Uncharacterized protein n=1 Tax=Potamilus streckersoni TaxID=2493646 RepID=A0AAE0S916_9BIVA|nr:hypothetical protein CHS0354_004869 [Potamilus streckersoni]
MKSKYKNLHFHLNDVENVILARDLVLLNILDNIDPDRDEDMEFYGPYDLLQISHSRVEYRTEETKEEVKRVLKYWLKGKMCPEDVKNKRFEDFKKRTEKAMTLEKHLIPPHMYKKAQFNAWTEEILNFVEKGSSQREGAVKDPSELHTNITLLCPHVNGWRAHPNGTPFHSYNLYS